MTRWQDNKRRAITHPDPVSMTDQSQARETDINVIVAKMGITGTVPGNAQEPMYGDWTQFPRDLREYIETARTMESLMDKLPDQLRGMSVEQLIAMTPDEMVKLITPATPPESKEAKKEA